jgi:hypothetical protein
MPVIDLRAILTPVIGQVADLVFPDTVAIEAPARTQDDTGDAIDTWDSVEDDVPALIEPLGQSRAGGGYFATVPTMVTDVTITLAGDRDIRQAYRIRAEYIPPDDPTARIGDRWDVAAVQRDPVRATTVILGRIRQPGTPDEGS